MTKLSAEEFYAAQIDEAIKRWRESGHLPVLDEILQMHAAWKSPLPDDVVIALRDLVHEKYFTSGGYRNADPKKIYTRDFIVFARWRAVERSRRMGALADHRFKDVLKRPALSSKAGRPKKGSAGPNPWLQQACVGAVELLKETIACGSKEQMEDDFRLVETARSGGNGARYAFDMQATVPTRK